MLHLLSVTWGVSLVHGAPAGIADPERLLLSVPEKLALAAR